MSRKAWNLCQTIYDHSKTAEIDAFYPLFSIKYSTFLCRGTIVMTEHATRMRFFWSLKSVTVNCDETGLFMINGFNPCILDHLVSQTQLLFMKHTCWVHITGGRLFSRSHFKIFQLLHKLVNKQRLYDFDLHVEHTDLLNDSFMLFCLCPPLTVESNDLEISEVLKS